MENQACVSCGKSKAPLSCGRCESAVCKSCVQFVDQDRLNYWPELPAEFKHAAYCPSCFDDGVSAKIAEFDELMGKAEKVSVYFKTQSKETRLMKRKHAAYVIENCPDRDEALMRLAFFAARDGFETLIDVDLISEKVRDGAYQTLKWKALGVPYSKRA